MTKRRTTALVPASARSAQPLTSTERTLADEGVTTFEEILGGREKLTQVLAVATDEPEVALVTDLLLDPRYQHHSLRQLCAMTGLTVADLLTAYRKAVIVQAHVQAAPIIAGKLIGVVEDLMTRAQPHYLPCATCHGSGSVIDLPSKDQPSPAPRVCTACTNGQQLHLPDLDRQKLALEVAELVKPKSGITFNQANVLGAGGGSSMGGSLEQLQQAVSDVLFPSAHRSAAKPNTSAIDVSPIASSAVPPHTALDGAPADLRLPSWTSPALADD